MHYNHTFNLDSLCKDENYIIIFYMAKTKGLRKVKHGKRHSRKKHGGEKFETMKDIINKKTELEKERKELDNNLEKLEVLSNLKAYSELKPWSEELFKRTSPKKYNQFIHAQTMIDENNNNPIENYKTYSKTDLKDKINSLETDLRNKVRNKGIGDLRIELNTLKTTCPTKVDVIVDKIRSDKTKGGYDSTFEGEIKSVGDFECNADGKGTIIDKDGQLRTVNAVNGGVPLQTKEELESWAKIQVEREEAEKKRKEKEDELAAARVLPLLKSLEKDPNFQLEDGSVDWEKIYNKFDTLKWFMPGKLTKNYEKFMKEKGLLLKNAKLRKQSQDGNCKHDAFTLNQIRTCDLKDKEGNPLSRNKILLFIHPDKQNNPECEVAAGEKFKTFINKDDPNADNEGDKTKGIPPNVQCKYKKGGKKKRSKKTQRKRKRKHHASSRH